MAIGFFGAVFYFFSLKIFMGTVRLQVLLDANVFGVLVERASLDLLEKSSNEQYLKIPLTIMLLSEFMAGKLVKRKVKINGVAVRINIFDLVSLLEKIVFNGSALPGIVGQPLGFSDFIGKPQSLLQ